MDNIITWEWGRGWGLRQKLTEETRFQAALPVCSFHWGHGGCPSLGKVTPYHGLCRDPLRSHVEGPRWQGGTGSLCWEVTPLTAGEKLLDLEKVGFPAPWRHILSSFLWEVTVP